MNYAIGCAFSIKNIFQNFKKHKLKMTSKLCNNIIGDNHKDKLIYTIFRESMKVIFNDIIDNNVTFELPTGSRRSDIHMQRYSDENFSKARRNGKWKEIDFLSSYFTGYQMELTMYNRDGKIARVKPIYLNKEFKDKITKNTNNGKQYC